MLVDPDLIIEFASSDLSEIMKDGRLFSRSDPKQISRSSRLATLVFQALEKGASGQTTIRIGGRNHVASILPVTSANMGGAAPSITTSARALVLIRPSGGEEAPTAADYDLTKVEMELVGHLARGSSVRQAASSMGVSYHTARKYLRKLYVKTGVNRQAGLVGLLTGPGKGRGNSSSISSIVAA